MRRNYIQVDKTEKMEKWRYYRSHEEILQGIISRACATFQVRRQPGLGTLGCTFLFFTRF